MSCTVCGIFRFLEGEGDWRCQALAPQGAWQSEAPHAPREDSQDLVVHCTKARIMIPLDNPINYVKAYVDVHVIKLIFC